MSAFTNVFRTRARGALLWEGEFVSYLISGVLAVCCTSTLLVLRVFSGSVEVGLASPPPFRSPRVPLVRDLPCVV